METEVLATSDTFKVVIDPYLANTGSATVQPYAVPNGVSGSITVGGVQ